MRGPGRKYGTPVSGWQQQLVSRIGVPDHRAIQGVTHRPAINRAVLAEVGVLQQRRSWQPPGGAASHRHRPALPGRGDVAGQEALEQNEPGAGAGGEHSPAVAVLEVGAGAAVDGGEESKKRSERHMGSEWQWKFAEGAGSGGSMEVQGLWGGWISMLLLEWLRNAALATRRKRTHRRHVVDELDPPQLDRPAAVMHRAYAGWR